MLHTDAFNAASAADSSLDTTIPARTVVRFYARLRKLPLGVWAELADTEPSARAISAAALKRLHARLDRLPGISTRVNRRVHELTAVAEEFVPAAAASRMKRVALSAALALLVREQIPEEDFRTLYEPFATVIPVAELEGDATGVRRTDITDAQKS